MNAESTLAFSPQGSRAGLQRTLRVALVGLGFGAEFPPIYRDHPQVASVALCDSNPDKLTLACSRFGIEEQFSSLEQVLAADHIDAVHLVTPIPLHAQQTLAVLRAGKHCACTVPMATSLADLREIVATERSSGKNYMMMETAVYTREFLYVQDLFQRQEFGEISFARGAHYQDMEGWPDYWMGLPPHHYMTHAVAPILQLLGKRVRKVHCLGSGELPAERRQKYGNPYPVETAIFKLEESKVAVEVTRSLFQTVRPYSEAFAIYGDKLGFEWQQIEEEDPLIFSLPSPGSGRGRKILHQTVEVPDRQDLLPPEIAPFTKKAVFSDGRHLSFIQGGGHSGSHPHLVHEFVSSIVERRPPMISAVTAANWTAPGIAAHQSALAEGAAVEVPDFSLDSASLGKTKSGNLGEEEASKTGRLSRRGFLKLASVGSAIWLASSHPPAFAQTREINIIGWNSQALMSILGRAEKEVGIKIKYDVLPAKWDNVMQKITLWGQTGYSDIDILFADDLIAGLWGMNGWAEDLSGLDAWTKHSGDVVENINVLNHAVGGVYRIFFFMGLETFFYNKKLVSVAPKTWDEFVSVAKNATKPGAAWGWRPLGGEGHAFNTALLALNQSGADLATLSGPAALKALQFIYDWVKTDKITPPSTVSEDNAAVESLAAAGKAAMWWSYESGFNNALTIDKSVLTPETIGVARWPQGPASDIGLAHGWGFLLSKFSKRKDAAKEIINWLAQTEVIRDIDIAQSTPPPYKSLFSDPQIIAKLPVLAAGPGWEELIRGAKFREPIVNHRQVTQLWTLFDKLGSYVLSGEKTPAETQAWALEEYASIQ